MARLLIDGRTRSSISEPVGPVSGIHAFECHALEANVAHWSQLEDVESFEGVVEEVVRY